MEFLGFIVAIVVVSFTVSQIVGLVCAIKDKKRAKKDKSKNENEVDTKDED